MRAGTPRGDGSPATRQAVVILTHIGHRTAGFILPALLVLTLMSEPIRACSVPVFRYALERWQSDTYRVMVVHRTPLTEDQQVLVDRIKSYSQTDDSRPSMTVQVIDIHDTNDVNNAMLASQIPNSSNEWPLMVLLSPLYYDNPDPLWHAPLNEETVSLLLDSRVRRDLVSGLTAGDTAVWLFLPGDHAETNKVARKVLADTLNKLERELKLPHELDASDTQYDMSLSEEVQLKIKFSILDLDYQDPTEAVVMSILQSGLGQDIRDSLPAAIPVYGRGRALMVLDTEQLIPDNIEALCSFLLGACSCDVKEQNPGVDLFIPIDWDSRITGMTDVNEALPMLIVPTPLLTQDANRAEPNTARPDVTDIHEDPSPLIVVSETPQSNKLNRNMGVLVLLGLAVVVGLPLLFAKRKVSQ